MSYRPSSNQAKRGSWNGRRDAKPRDVIRCALNLNQAPVCHQTRPRGECRTQLMQPSWQLAVRADGAGERPDILPPLPCQKHEPCAEPHPSQDAKEAAARPRCALSGCTHAPFRNGLARSADPTHLSDRVCDRDRRKCHVGQCGQKLLQVGTRRI